MKTCSFKENKHASARMKKLLARIDFMSAFVAEIKIERNFFS